MGIEVALVGLVTSLIGNIYQFYNGKKSRDLDAIKKEIELLQQLQATKDKAYEEALRVKDLQIQQLTEEVKSQTEMIEQNTSELKRMQKIVTFLIANGCQEASTCSEHCPYSMEDLDNIVKGKED
jgi:replication fork clamp-binding protein CrfC